MNIVSCEAEYIDFLGARVTTEEELKQVITSSKEKELVFMCSSSMDWPEDSTNNPTLIYLCDLIRNNNVSGENPEFAGLEKLFE